MSCFLVCSSSLEEVADSGLQLGNHVLPEVADPLGVALQECQILLLVGLEVLELLILPA